MVWLAGVNNIEKTQVEDKKLHSRKMRGQVGSGAQRRFSGVGLECQLNVLSKLIVSGSAGKL